MTKYYNHAFKLLLVTIIVFAIGMRVTKVFSAPSNTNSASSFLTTTSWDDVTDTSVTLSGVLDVVPLTQLWNVSESQLRYWFQYSKNSSAGGAGSTSTPASSLTSGSNVASRRITGLQENQQYYYRVCATDYAGHSACSTVVVPFMTMKTPVTTSCTDTGLPNRSYVITQAENEQPTTELIMQNHPEALVGSFVFSGATGTVCGWEAIQLVSPSNPFPLLTSIKISLYGGEVLINMPVDANTFQWNGSHYYAWYHFKDPVPVFEGDVKHMIITGTTGNQAGFFTVGIGGVNHQSPGASVSGLPLFDRVIVVENY